jgi:uncharacterized membrane protein YhaH (DUF805 family)
MNDYFVKIEFQPEFGINSTEMIKRINEGQIPSNALVRKVDSEVWKPLTNYPELVYVTPPPLPNMQNKEEQKSEPLGPNIKKSETPNYFLPNGRIGRINWLLRNTINSIAFFIIAYIFTLILPEELALILIIPYLCYFYICIITSVKRLHDLNVTGWIVPIIFIPLVWLFLLILSGTEGSNRFGEKPENLFS